MGRKKTYGIFNKGAQKGEKQAGAELCQTQATLIHGPTLYPI